MKIGVLIEKLKEFQEKHGDEIEVAVLIDIHMYEFGFQEQQLGDNDTDTTHITIVYDDETEIEY